MIIWIFFFTTIIFLDFMLIFFLFLLRTRFVAQNEAVLMAEKITVVDCCDFWLKR